MITTKDLKHFLNDRYGQDEFAKEYIMCKLFDEEAYSARENENGIFFGGSVLLFPEERVQYLDIGSVHTLCRHYDEGEGYFKNEDGED